MGCWQLIRANILTETMKPTVPAILRSATSTVYKNTGGIEPASGSHEVKNGPKPIKRSDCLHIHISENRRMWIRPRVVFTRYGRSVYDQIDMNLYIYIYIQYT